MRCSVELRGLIHTGRSKQAAQHLEQHVTAMTEIPPQWQAILTTTHGEALLVVADVFQAAIAFQGAILIAERHRLPHQIQRILRASGGRLPAIHELAQAALDRLKVAFPSPHAAINWDGY